MARKGGREMPDKSMGVFMISVAAELAGMHPQTLRVYEQRGLIRPQRSPKQTRLYSQEDVERLKLIQELTTVTGMNLAGVERFFDLQDVISELKGRLERMNREIESMQARLAGEVEAVHRHYRREIVLYDPIRTEIVRASEAGPPEGFKIPIEHRK